MTLIRYLLRALTLAALILLAPWPAVTFADGNTPITTGSNSVSQIQLSALAVTLAISLLIPLVTGLLTKASSKVKGIVTIVLNAANSLIVTGTMADGTAIISKETFISTVIATLVSLGTYLQVYKPLGVTSSTVLDADGNAVPGKLAAIGNRD